MINYIRKQQFELDSVYKRINIHYFGGSTIAENADMYNDEFSVEDILCDGEDLTFGEACARKVTFTTTVTEDLAGAEIGISEKVAEYSEDFNYGRFFVKEERYVESKGKNKVKEVTAYDPIYTIYNTDVTDWYNGLWESASTYTQKQFRDSFFANFDVYQMPITLDNDTMTVKRTVSGKINGATVLKSILATNGCFGRMNETGNGFEYFYLPQIAQNLSNAYEIAKNGYYMSETHAKYTTQAINKLIIRDEDNEEIITVGSGDNAYVMANNMLLYGKTATELQTIAQNIYNRISVVTYVPFEIEVKGNPCFQVGDPVYFTTVDGEVVSSYILRRNYKGIQSQKDTYSADGFEKRAEVTVSVNDELIKLRNKTNRLDRDLEHTTSVLEDEVLDPDNPLSLKSEIDQTASDITLKVDKTSGQSGDSFSYVMNSSKAEFKNSGNTVLKIDSSGAVINGKVTAKSGYIGNGSSGFTIGNTSIYNGLNSMSATGTGVYIGTDGINLGYNFRVTSGGVADITSARFGKIKINSGNSVNDGDIIFYKTAIDQVQSARLYLDSSDSNYFNIEGIYVDISASDGLTLNGKAYNKCLNQVWTGTNGNYDLLFSESASTTTTKDEGARKGRLHWNPYLERLMFTNTTTGAMIENPSNQTLYLRASHEADYGVNVGIVDSAWAFAPIVDNKMRLGSSSCRWTTIYAINGTINTSDRRQKKCIKPLQEKAKDFIMDLKPVSYKFKDGDRTHYGLIAQDVEETMTELGMTDMDFAGFCKDQKTKSVKKKVEIDGIEREIDVDEPIEGQYTYGLRYEEFIAPLIYMVQKLLKEVEDLKGRIK